MITLFYWKCSYHKKFLADFLNNPLALLSAWSLLLLLLLIKFEANEIIPPANPLPDSLELLDDDDVVDIEAPAAAVDGD